MAQKCSPQRILVCLRAKLSKCVQQALCCFMRARGNDVGELLQFLANTNRERKTNPLNGDRSWSMFLAKSFCPAPSRNMQSQMRCHEALGRVEVQRLKLTFIKSHTCNGLGSLVDHNSNVCRKKRSYQKIGGEENHGITGHQTAEIQMQSFYNLNTTYVQTTVVGIIQLYSVHRAERPNYIVLCTFLKHATFMA